MVHRRIPGWQRDPVPDGTLELAASRTAFLEGSAMREPLQYLLACAYLQGCRDTVQALDSDRGRALLASPAP